MLTCFFGVWTRYEQQIRTATKTFHRQYNLPQKLNGSQLFPNTQTNVFSWFFTGGFKLPVLFITCDSVMKEMALFLKVHVMKRDDYS